MIREIHKKYFCVFKEPLDGHSACIVLWLFDDIYSGATIVFAIANLTRVGHEKYSYQKHNSK